MTKKDPSITEIRVLDTLVRILQTYDFSEICDVDFEGLRRTYKRGRIRGIWMTEKKALYQINQAGDMPYGHYAQHEKAEGADGIALNDVEETDETPAP